jgi:hypothetical protein
MKAVARRPKDLQDIEDMLDDFDKVVARSMSTRQSAVFAACRVTLALEVIVPLFEGF